MLSWVRGFWGRGLGLDHAQAKRGDVNLCQPLYHGHYTGLWFGVLNILFGVFYRLAVPVGLQACHMRLLSAGCLAQTTLAQADHAAVKLHARALSHMSGVKMSVRKRQ